jgi:PRTRC genetic system protein E
MFQQLKPLVAKSPIAMNVVAEGDLLRVTIAQKTSRRGAPLNISVLASAEDLDRDLPGEIDKAASQTPAPAPIAEQVKAQVTAAAPAKPKKAAPAAKPAKKTKPAKAPRVSKPKPLKQAKAPKIAPKHKIRLPGTGKKKAAPHASRLTPHAPSDDGVKHHASKPGKEQCIADYKAMKAKHGDKLNRELFLDKSDTGRRFERLWGMSWKKFVEEAEGSKIKADVPAAVAPRAARKPAVAPADPQLPLLPGTWPFPESKTSSAIPPAVPEVVLFQNEKKAKEFNLERFEPIVNSTPRVQAKQTTEAPTASVASAPAAAADPVNETVDTSKPHPPRVVKEKSGKLIAGGFTQHVKPGQELNLADRKWIVAEANERYVIVEWPRT